MTEVRRIANAAADDGPVAYETGLLAKLGAGGSQLKNASRDFERFVKTNHNSHLDLCWVPVHFKKASGIGGVEERPIPIFLPHEIVWVLFTYHPRLFERIFINSEEEVLRYWDRVRCEDWFEAHPGRAAVEKRPQCALPLRIHGGDAPVSKGCSGLLLNFGSPLSYAESSFLSVFPLFYVLLRYILECSVENCTW